MVETELMLTLAREESRFCIISQVLVLVFFRSELCLSFPLLISSASLLCKISFLYPPEALQHPPQHLLHPSCGCDYCRTGSFFLPLRGFVCVCTYTILDYVTSSIDWIKATVYTLFITESAYLFSSFSDSCLDRLFLDIHSISTPWLHLTLI